MKAKVGDYSWVWNQASAFASGVTHDKILDYFPHIDFVPLQQCIKEDCFVPSYFVNVL